DALREFFQHVRDEELGRWRWPKDPDYVVYPTEDGFLVVRESVGLSEFRNGLYVHDMEGEAARDYREAHPERKPWEDAMHGEAWVITYNGGEHAVLCDGAYFTWPAGSMQHISDPDITAAR